MKIEYTNDACDSFTRYGKPGLILTFNLRRKTKDGKRRNFVWLVKFSKIGFRKS